MCSAFDNAFENNENINLYTHSEKIHKWDQEKCSDFQNQIDFRKIYELKMLLIGFIHMRNKSPLSTAKSGNLSPQIFHGSQI